MKKFISSIITLFILLTIIWSVSSWYFGSKAENNFRFALSEKSSVSGESLFSAELISYKRTWIGANAILRISSDNTFFSERFGEFDAKVNLLNGPVFFDDSGVSIGTSRWIIQPDELSLSEAQLLDLRSYFPDIVPVLTVTMDFNQKAHYVGELQSKSGKVLLTGEYDLESEDNKGVVSIDDFTFDDTSKKLSAKNIKLGFQHQKSITASYKPGTATLLIPELTISTDLLRESVTLAIKAESHISSKNNNLNGFIKLVVENKNTAEIPVNNAVFTVQFVKLAVDTFIQLSEAKAEIDNLQQQIGWVLQEQGEVPEGQDHIWQLQDQIEQASTQLPIELMQNAFNHGESQIKIEINTTNNSGSSMLSGIIKPADYFALSDLLISYLQAEAEVKLDDELFKFLNLYTAINKKQFSLMLKQNKLLMQ